MKTLLRQKKEGNWDKHEIGFKCSSREFGVFFIGCRKPFSLEDLSVSGKQDVRFLGCGNKLEG